MSLPVPARTWQYNPNNLAAGAGTALAQNQTLMWALKEALKGNAAGGTWTDASGTPLGGAPTGGWAVWGSSDGVGGFGNNDANDRWAAAANLIWANAGSNHSWIVLKNTALAANYCICIDLCNAGATSSATIVLMPTGPSVNGTATARPTAADEVVLINNAAWGGTTTTSTGTRWSVMLSTDGLGTRILGFRANWDVIFVDIQRPTDTPSGWANPASAMWRGASTAAPTGKNTTLGAMNVVGSKQYGVKIGATAGLCCNCVDAVGSGACPSVQAVATDASGAFPFYPLGLFSDSVGLRGRNGTLVDLWCALTNTAVPTTYPNDATRQFVAFSDFVIPWNGSIPSTS